MIIYHPGLGLAASLLLYLILPTMSSKQQVLFKEGNDLVNVKSLKRSFKNQRFRNKTRKCEELTGRRSW